MTQKEKNIKIAEACGWKRVEQSDNDYINGLSPIYPWTNGKDWADENGEDLPNYFESLDACREMERTGYRDQPAGFSFLYNKKLKELTAKSHDVLEYNWSWHVSAATKAEAFGQTLKLW